jgi:hypothetical protein
MAAKEMKHGANFTGRTAGDVDKSRSSCVVPRSNPSAMLLETERAARSIWERNEAGDLKPGRAVIW